MKNKFLCIMLVDDDSNDNFFHEREIKKTNPNIIVIEKYTGLKALQYIKSEKENKGILPDLIFLDINMPGMNGWDFLKEYEKLDKDLQSEVVIIMLTSSDNDDDITKAKEWSSVTDFITKPLTKDKMMGIMVKYFN